MQSTLYGLRKTCKHYTQQQMADYLGISAKSYRDKELGRREFTQDEMFEIAKLFNRKIDDIFLPRTYRIGTKN